MPERGLRPHETATNLAAMIESQCWGKFTDQPKPTVFSIVKEFYVNAKEIEGRVVQVKGKMVSYDKSSFNAYYRTPDIQGDDEFTEYMREDIDLEEVIQTLCRPGAIWKSKEHETISFSAKGA